MEYTTMNNFRNFSCT